MTEAIIVEVPVEAPVVQKGTIFDWKKYKKLIPAILGVALLIGLDYLKIERIPGLDAAVLDMIVGSATVFGIGAVKNKPFNAP